MKPAPLPLIIILLRLMRKWIRQHYIVNQKHEKTTIAHYYYFVFFLFFIFCLKCGLAIWFSAKSFKQLFASSGLWINLSSINSIFVLLCAFEVFQYNFSLKTGYRPTSCLLIKGICEMSRLTKRLNAWVINATHFNLNEIILISPESLKVNARLILLCPA